MTSYLRYQKELRTVQDADDIESWITVRGNHIPIKKGQSKEDAVKSFLENKGRSASKSENPKKESKYDPEFETVRKNALANGNVYGGRYTQKSKAEAYKEYKKDTKKEQSIFDPADKIDYSKLKDKDIRDLESLSRNLTGIYGKKNKEAIEYTDKLNRAKKAKEFVNEKPESSKKWSGAWSKRANKPETLGNSAKNATSISKMTKMSASERNEEVGYPMLEIANNDVKFTSDPEKNRSALSKAIKESGHENADLMQSVLSNLSAEELKDTDSVRKGIRDYMKSYNKKKTTDSWHRLWSKK